MKQGSIGRAAERPPTNLVVRRFSIYTISIMLFAVSLPPLASIENAAAFKENGLVELLQLGGLLAVGLLFFRASRSSYPANLAYIVLSCLSIFAAIREMDAIVDPLLPLLGWKIAYVFPAYAAYTYFENKRVVARQVRDLVASNGFFLLWAGFIIAIPFAQLVGNTAFLQAVMTDDYSRDYRRIIEELGELMGYGLILIGSIELTVSQRVRDLPPRTSPLVERNFHTNQEKSPKKKSPIHLDRGLGI